MSRRLRITIAGCAACSLAAALGLAAIRVAPAEAWADVVMLLTCGVLTLATIGAVCRESRGRTAFVGFAVFGWGYFTLAHWYTNSEGPLPTVWFLPGSGRLHGSLLELPPMIRIAHDAWALAFAVVGGILAERLATAPAAGETISDLDDPSVHDTRRWWHKPAWLGLLGVPFVVVATIVAWRIDAATGAGTAFLLTWALVGLLSLGACLDRGRRREVWIGAASFGVGYLVLAFGPALAWELPSNHLLNAVFHVRGPSPADDAADEPETTDAESRRIQAALDMPVSLHFPEPTPLKVVVGPIVDTIRGPSGKDPVFYGLVRPLLGRPEELDGLLVTIGCEKTPAKDALRQILKQLGLAYRVHAGDIRVFPDVYQAMPFDNDPAMIGGHSLLALLAAVIGGVAGPLVARTCTGESAVRGARSFG